MLKRRWNYNLVIYLCGHRSLCVYALKLPLSPRVISVCWRLENNNSLSILQMSRARFSNTHLTCVMLSRVPCSTQNTWLYMHVRKTVGRNTLFFNNLMKVAMCCASFGLPICHNHHHHLPPLNHLKGSITQTAVTGCHRDDRSALWWREV